MAKKKPKPGPKPDRLKLDGKWQDRLKDALAKEPPEDGWPKPESRPKKKPRDG